MITHPFHPLRGKTFPLLKARLVAGVETLILQGSSQGTFAVPKEWTDQADPCADYYLNLNDQLPIFNPRLLLALVEMIQQCEREDNGGFPKGSR